MPSYSELASRLLNFESRCHGTGVSDDEIAVAERLLGRPILGSYREFLRHFGWGGVQHLELFGLGAPPHLDLVRVTQSERTEMNPALPSHLIPVMNNGGGSLFCLDTTVANDPPIVFWDHEAGVDQVPEVVAKSFSAWLWGLLNNI